MTNPTSISAHYDLRELSRGSFVLEIMTFRHQFDAEFGESILNLANKCPKMPVKIPSNE